MTMPDASPPPALAAENLTLRRGQRVLFEGLGFTLAPGGALLLRGPNGAGKTSLLLALSGIIPPLAGKIVRTGELHLLLPQNAIKPRLSSKENLEFWREVNGPTGVPAEAALERVGLGGLGMIEAGHLSTGQQRRLALARLIVSTRGIWLLDEPTAALDAAGDALVGELVGAHCAAGGLAVVATHHDIALPTGQAAQTLTLGRAA